MLSCTMVQIRRKHSKNSQLIIAFFANLGVSEQVSGASEWAKG